MKHRGLGWVIVSCVFYLCLYNVHGVLATRGFGWVDEETDTFDEDPAALVLPHSPNLEEREVENVVELGDTELAGKVDAGLLSPSQVHSCCKRLEEDPTDTRKLEHDCKKCSESSITMEDMQLMVLKLYNAQVARDYARKVEGEYATKEREREEWFGAYVASPFFVVVALVYVAVACLQMTQRCRRCCCRRRALGGNGMFLAAHAQVPAG